MIQQDDTDSLQIAPDPDKLDRYHRQQLSAMLDGELSPDQARFMLRRLQHDLELADCWERWQVCGDVLRGQRNALLPADFAQKVSAAIAGDAQQAVAAARGGRPRLLRWGGGAALAASVAMAALLVARQPGVGPEQVPLHAAPALAAAGAPASEPVVDDPSPAPEPMPVIETAAVLAGTALAAAEAPRRARAQPAAEAASPRAARSRRSADQAPQAVAVAAVDDAPVSVLAANDAMQGASAQVGQAPVPVLAALPSVQEALQGIGADPFEALPMTVASRPWPRASVSGLGNPQHAAALGTAMQQAPVSFHPFEPQQQVAPSLFGAPAGQVQTPPAATATTAIGADAVPAAGAPAVKHPGPR